MTLEEAISFKNEWFDGVHKCTGDHLPFRLTEKRGISLGGTSILWVWSGIWFGTGSGHARRRPVIDRICSFESCLTGPTMIKLRPNLCDLRLSCPLFPVILPEVMQTDDSCHALCTVTSRFPWNILDILLMLLSFLAYSWWDCAGCDWETGQGWCSQVGRRM